MSDTVILPRPCRSHTDAEVNSCKPISDTIRATVPATVATKAKEGEGQGLLTSPSQGTKVHIRCEVDINELFLNLT